MPTAAARRRPATNEPPPGVRYVDYQPFGATRELFRRRDPAVVIIGPGGTGKSRGCLEKCNWLCEKYPGVRGLMVRKTRVSLTQSAMVTFEQKVLPSLDSVKFHGGDQEYRYPNGSVLAVAGLDKPQKIFSSEWDFAYAQQAEELEQEDWESVLFRLRNGKMPYQQLIGDINPAATTHWIRNLVATGAIVLLESRHEDNPFLWDVKAQKWTEMGAAYIAKLDSLTGVRYRRYRLGQWASAEGAVYEESWDPAVHVINRFNDDPLDKDQVPKDWPRLWTIDFGYTNPFVWQAWAQDPDGRLFRYKEIYKTKTIVEDHAKKILEVTKDEPKPRAIICDHDAEDRATLERHLGMTTKPAWKSVRPGIQAVESRLRKAGDGKPRLFFLRDSVIEIDAALLEEHKPTSTETEIESYIWDKSNNRKLGEEPVKENDHGADATRYLITHVDKTGSTRRSGFAIGSVSKGDGGSGPGSGWRSSGALSPRRFGQQ